jgi:hypothetical protein
METLYTANVFSVKGTIGLTTFQSITPLPQWQKIRRLHLSTMFLTPEEAMPAHKHFPPESFSQWTNACETLVEMRGLRSLQIEMTVRDLMRKGPAFVDDESLELILKPLNQIIVPVFEVEMNMSIPDVVLARLGQLTFTFVEKHREVNRIILDISY